MINLSLGLDGAGVVGQDEIERMSTDDLRIRCDRMMRQQGGL